MASEAQLIQLAIGSVLSEDGAKLFTKELKRLFDGQ